MWHGHGSQRSVSRVQSTLEVDADDIQKHLSPHHQPHDSYSSESRTLPSEGFFEMYFL